MKSARHQLILLGFLCQGLSWDDYFLPAGYTLLWVICLLLRHRNLRAGPVLECFLLIAGCLAGLILARWLGHSTHFFIGHGLVAIQAVRLLRPLSSREKLTSLLIACFHLGVGCTFVFDLRFLLILFAAVILVPRSFIELAAENFGQTTFSLPRFRFVWALAAGAIMVLFFLACPRLFVSAPIALRNPARGDQASMLDTLLDPSRSGLANSSRILLQIEGEGIGYLRCFSLVDTDGVRWTAAQRPPLKRIEYIPRERLNAYLHRRVQVKNVAFLARMLPADGSVVQITGKFFNRAFQNAHGGIEADSMWNASRNVYEYWIQTNAPPERIFLAQFRRYTNYPPQSARLQTWLDQSLEGIPDPLAQARHLEKIFHSQFTYRLGAPQLDRLNAIDQFILNEREGHCERFAASLALLLRMKGIPSRVVIGYVPGTRNRFTGAWNVRFKDAHSWTEAYFPNHGWVQFDATPPASRSPEDEKWSLREFIEDLDFAWSSYIVNFDASGQSQLLSATVHGLSQSARWVRQHLIWTLPVVALIGLAFLCKHWPKWRWAVLRRKTARPVSHYYGEMLQLLDEFGLTKLDQQTPYEFLAEIQQRGFALCHDVDLVTRFFCAHRYGRQPLTDSETSQIEDALRRLQAFRGGQNASA